MTIKRVVSVIIICTIILSLAATSFASATTTQSQKTTALKDLGLLSGRAGFDLTKSLTKTEAVVIYLRLLGKDSEVKKSTYKNPFKDVPTWAAKYIAYACNKGLASGTSKTIFGSSAPVPPEQFLIYMLRALGYSDKAGGDFTAKTAIQYAEKLGIVTKGKYKAGSKTFNRGNCVDIIYSVLSANKKGGKIALAKSLVDSKAIDSKIASKYGFYVTTQAPTTTPASTSISTPASPPPPQYQMVKVSLTNENNGYIAIRARDVIAAIPGAKYVCYNWSDTVSLTDYKSAYSVIDYNELINPNKTAESLDYLTKSGGQYVNAKEVTPTSRIMVSAYDEKANMIAAAISTSKDAMTKGYLEFAIVNIDGAKLIASLNAAFDAVFGSPTVVPDDAISYIEKCIPVYLITDKKTGKVTNTIRDTGRPLYRYVIDSKKYPELAEKTRYFAEGTVTSGLSLLDSIRTDNKNYFQNFGMLNLNAMSSISDYVAGSNNWTTKPTEWNKMRYIIFADTNKKYISYTQFVPSQKKIVDVGDVKIKL